MRPRAEPGPPSDLRDLHMLVDRIYGTLDGSVSWEEAMVDVARATRTEPISLTTAGRDGSVRQVSYPFDPAGVLEYAANYADKDVRVPRVVMARRRGLFSTQDLMTAEEIARCPVHNEYYRKYPECWITLGVAIEAEGTLQAPIFHRGARYGLYGERERRLVDTLSRHLVRAAHLQQLMTPDAVSGADIVAALDGIADGLVVFDGAGRVVHLNAPARRLVAARDGVELADGVLTASHHAAREALHRLVVGVLMVACGQAADLPAPVALPRAHEGRALTVRGFVSPERVGGPRMGLLTLQGAGEWRLPSPAQLQALAGLTPAEAHLARALLEGASLRAHATRNGLSEETVRVHMKHVREKLCVHTQAQAVAALLRLAGLA